MLVIYLYYSESSNEESSVIIHQPTEDEIRKAREYYETQVDGKLLDMVAKTMGVMINLKVTGTPKDAIAIPFDGNEVRKSLLIQTASRALQMYRNFSQPKGLCLIINNRNFAASPPRLGTDVDAKNAMSLFTLLGYRVELKNDCTAAVRSKSTSLVISIINIFFFLKC
jgi:hypothetical protein